MMALAKKIMIFIVIYIIIVNSCQDIQVKASNVNLMVEIEESQ